MSWLTRLHIDRFLITLIVAAVLASVFPASGVWAQVLESATITAIALLFFLYGARLSPSETWVGLKHWRLHLVILAFTYLVFPLTGWVVAAVTRPLLGEGLGLGILFLSLVPSTVQSSIAFTSIAGGNVAGAIVSASASNILGVFLTPVLVWLLMSSTGEVSFTLGTVFAIIAQIFLPFVAGQLSRPWTAGFVSRHPELKLVDRGSIVLVVFSAFSAGMTEGMWAHTGWLQLGVLTLVCIVGVVAMLALTWWVAIRLGFNRADAIAIQFCGTKKSLASGLPMAGVLFAGQPLGLLMLPLVLFHQIQLMICSVLAERYARQQPSLGTADLPTQR